MGCVSSSVVEEEEAVRRCRERRRLTKQLMVCRSDLAASLLAYLQSLRNTGATLRQFAEDGSMSPPADPLSALRVPPHSPFRLPPSPPPPPRFSTDNWMDLNDAGSGICTPPPPPPPPPSWDLCGPSDADPSPHSPLPSPRLGNGNADKNVEAEHAEDENWAETNSEFVDRGDSGENRINPVALRPLAKNAEKAMDVRSSSNTLSGIARELDDNFLTASASGTGVLSLLESNRSHRLDLACKGKWSKSAKVFSSLYWKWSYRPGLSGKDASEFQGGNDYCHLGGHCMTLAKIHAEEVKLHEMVKDEEVAKLQYKRKILLLHKQEARQHDRLTLEKTRANIEELDSRIRSLRELISETCFSIAKLRDKELHLQIVSLSSRLLKMWRIMHDCHQVQNHVAQQTINITFPLKFEPTGGSHCHVTTQLEVEITSWYSSFHKLLKSQREYIHTLNQWVKLTDCLPHDQPYERSSDIFTFCNDWLVAVDRLPYKATADAIKGFISLIHSIALQLVEEHKQQKKSQRLERRLEEKTVFLKETEVGHQDNRTCNPSPKQMKLESLRKRVSEEKSKYLVAVRTSRVMMLKNLQTSLPNVFETLTGFSEVCVQEFESLCQYSNISTNTCSSPLI